MEQIFTFIQTVDPLVVLLAVFAVAFVENLFPPSPSDLLVVAAGSVVGLGRLGFAETVLAAAAGSTVGFVTMYKIGDWFGDRILEQGKIKFIPLETVRKVERWFQRYGYWVVVANRFLAGTRAVVSFFAGMSELNLPRTTLLSFVSALAWNSVLVGAGYLLGKNWEKIGFYLSTYSQIVTAAIIVLVIVLIVKYFSKKNNGSQPS